MSPQDRPLPRNWRVYTVYPKHFETGMGLRQQILVCLAQDEQDVREQFLNEHHDEDELRAYLGSALQLSEGVDRELLAPFCSILFLDNVERTARWGWLKFSWHLDMF